VWREHWLHDPPATLIFEKVPIPALRGKICIKKFFLFMGKFFVYDTRILFLELVERLIVLQTLDKLE
jgi:hypothetical protein